MELWVAYLSEKDVGTHTYIHTHTDEIRFLLHVKKKVVFIVLGPAQCVQCSFSRKSFFLFPYIVSCNLSVLHVLFFFFPDTPSPRWLLGSAFHQVLRFQAGLLCLLRAFGMNVVMGFRRPQHFCTAPLLIFALFFFFFLCSLSSVHFFFFGTNNLKRKQNKKNERNRRQTPKKKKNTHTHQLCQHRFFFLFLASRFLCYFIFNLISFFFFCLLVPCSLRKVPINRVVYCSSSLSEGSRDLLLLLFFFCS